MDQALGTALRIVLDNDVRDPELLFTVIIGVYEDAGGSDFDALRSGFTERAGQQGFSAVAEELVRHAEGNGGADFFRAVKETGIATLLDELRLAAVPDEVDESYDEGDQVDYPADHGSTVAEPDPEVWQAFLAEFGPSWNGTEEAWEIFTPYFLFYANEHGVQVFAEAFLENAPATTPERIEYFTAYGVTIGAPEVVESEDDVLEALSDLFTEVDLTLAIGEMQGAALGAAVEQVLAEVPGAAAMPPEQLGEILSAALTEVIVEAMAGESA